LEVVFGVNFIKLREVMLSDSQPDFMQAIDHAQKMRNAYADDD